MRKGHNQIGLKILGAKGTQDVEKDPEMAEKLKGQFGKTSPIRVTLISTNL